MVCFFHIFQCLHSVYHIHAASLFVNLIFSSAYIQTISFMQYIHLSPFVKVPLHLLIAGQLSGKNLPISLIFASFIWFQNACIQYVAKSLLSHLTYSLNMYFLKNIILTSLVNFPCFAVRFATCRPSMENHQNNSRMQ